MGGVRPQYLVVPVPLVPDPQGVRRRVVEEYGDFIAVDVVRSSADLRYVRWAVDDRDLLPVSLSYKIDVRPSFFRSIRVEWDPVNDNKVLVIVIGREASLEISPPQGVAITEERIGLDKLIKTVEEPTYRLLVKIADSAINVPVVKRGSFKDEAVLFSGTVTSSGSTADIWVEVYSAMELQLKVTAVSGTSPTLSVYVEGKFATTGDYKTLIAWENITSTGIYYGTITQLIFRYIRIRWVVAGTDPSFTFRVDAVRMA